MHTNHSVKNDKRGKKKVTYEPRPRKYIKHLMWEGFLQGNRRKDRKDSEWYVASRLIRSQQYWKLAVWAAETGNKIFRW